MKRRILKRTLSTFLVAVLSTLAFYSAFAANDSFEAEISAFPESYKPYLRELHEKYPKWEFVALDTGLDWSQAIATEASGNRNLVPKSSSNMLKSKASSDYNASTGAYYEKDAGWVCANTAAVSYFMDPRNFLCESNIFQFELLSFSSSITLDIVEEMLEGTFMHNSKITYYDTEGKQKTINRTYGEVIFNAGKANNINPCYLVSKIRNEVILSSGKGSGSVSGKYSGYEGYYNFYNIGAYDGKTPIANGLKWAKSGTTYQRPWTDPVKSLEGGAKYLAEKYINVGQDTGYLQKFNVSPSAGKNVYSHQYMTNVSGADSQGYTTYKTYVEYDLMPLKRVFSIPVFSGMPGMDEQAEDFYLLDSYNNKGTVNVNSLNLRKTAHVSGEKVTTLNKGTTVTVLSKCRIASTYFNYFLNYPYWYEVKATVDSKTYTGFVCADYVDLTTTVNINVGAALTSNVNTGTVNATSLNVRSSASTAGDKVVTIPNGTAVKIISTVNTSSSQYPTWYKVSFTYGGKSYTGYVYTEYITIDTSASAKGSDITPYYYCSTDEEPLFYPSDPSLISVDSNGKLKASGKGSTYIMAVTSKGGFDYIKVNLTDSSNLSGVKNLTYSQTGSTATFKWSAVSGASGYEVLVMNGDKAVALKRTSNTKADVDLKSSNSYTVYVRAYSLSSGTRKNGDFTAVSIKGGSTAPSQVRELSLSGVSTDAYTVSWDSVAGADGYEVWILKEGKSSYSLHKSTKSSSCKVSDRALGSNDKIKVRAYVESYGEKSYGKFSSALSAYTYHKSLKGLTQKSAAADRLKLSWNDVSGASKYVLYFEEGGKMKKIGESEKTSYTVRSLSSFKNYKITVVAIKVEDGKNIRYAGKTLNAGTCAKTPDGLKVQSTDSGSVTVKWSSSKGADAYRIYRYDNKNNKFKLLAQLSETTYTVSGLSACWGAEYAVRAGTYIDGSLFFGDYSDIIYASTGPAKVSGLKVTLRSDGTGVLKWTKVSGADVYYIYKSSSKNGKYEYIGKSTTTSYTVKKPDENAYYAVRALCEKNSVKFKGTLSSPITF